MPPNSKRRGLKSIFSGLRSAFRSSKGRAGDEEPMGHDMPTMESSPSNTDTSTPFRKPEGSTTGAAIMVNASEDLLPHHSDADPSTAERAHSHPPPTEHAQSMSMFSNAQKVKMDHVTFNSSQHVHKTQDGRKGGWEMLLKNIASNALHDSSARFDAPKCDEGTRVEVTKELMDWVQDREGPQRLLCMTGAAGAGKSALQQTIAGKCSKSNTLGSAFFFSAGDPTRNNLTHIVPTIAYQLGLRNTALRDAIGKSVKDDPPIFKKTLRIQMETLIVAPFQRVCASGALDSSTFPHAILIDGLDECSGEDNQDELLSTIKHCLLDNDLPFRIFIASRPEWAIRTALDNNPEGYLYQHAYHVKLSDMYDATGDIRHYLCTRLSGIGSRSRDRRAQSPLWPTKEDIEKLVGAASGQFVYAATVVKYVSERRGSPVDRLRAIIDWTPKGGQQIRPLELLDVLYRNILSNAKQLYEVVDTNQGRDFLSLVRAHQMNSERRIGGGQYSTHDFDEIIGLEEGGHQVLFSDLHSLVFVRPRTGHTKVWEEMQFYHLSFSEFLDSEFRAQHLFVSETRVRQYVVDSCLQKLLQQGDLLDERSFARIIDLLHRYSDKHITYVDDLRLIDFTRNNGWGRIDKGLSSPVERNPLDADDWYGLARFTFNAIQHLNDDLHEHELADTVKSYFDKWKERYKEDGFTEKEEEKKPSPFY